MCLDGESDGDSAGDSMRDRFAVGGEISQETIFRFQIHSTHKEVA